MKYKILVIEDDPVLADNLCQILENEGYDVEYAENGKIGIEKAKKDLPDLIVSDIMMPEIDGFEVLMELSHDEETASIPFIFLTAKSDIDELRKGMSLGAEDYIFKPFNINDLLNSIQIRLKKKEINQHLIEKAKKQIFSKIHHDLRTPMVPILGYSDMIEQEEDVEQIKSMVKVIKQSSKKLFDRVEKFLIYNDLDLKRFNGNNLEVQEATINDEVLKIIIIGFNNNLDATERVKVNLSPAKLRMGSWCFQVMIREILENALKYSPKDKPVLVEGFVLNSFYNLTVTDFGRGMTQEEIKSVSVFNKFGDNKVAEPGLGIGLSIVKKIASIYDFEFNIISIPGEKTTCHFRIPLYNKVNL